MRKKIDPRDRWKVRVRWAWPLVLVSAAFALLGRPVERGGDEVADRGHAGFDENDVREMPEEDEDA
jgi:hypothetical protein